MLNLNSEIVEIPLLAWIVRAVLVAVLSIFIHRFLKWMVQYF